MLSKKSEKFLIELRMYLISKGKNDEEMNSIIEELEDHLVQAETDGKSIKEIIGSSPKEYMKSIGETMPIDLRQLASLVPITVLLIAAYFSLTPAILGEFALSPAIILFASIGAVFGASLYALFLFKGMPKLVHSKWKTFALFFLVYAVVTGGMVAGIFWWNKQGFEPTFVATSFQNKLILLACVVIIIFSAIYLKAWYTIIVAVYISILSVMPLLSTNGIMNEATYIAILVGVFSLTAIGYFIFKKNKKPVMSN